ncbi:MAG: nitrous oxide reductase family maturation protein NosD [Nitrospirae bacterium]|nr:nitrous oxide reductase family maturation protein NosD [Nitrospirota bacterium]MBF0534641.1 nitrous oxide reductase family maturation protein NosD [Nitrospirota bacterium]MBF0616315.1 nitrous oxide reductase family maturation protein NosD [Nitrospirota bacterium]
MNSCRLISLFFAIFMVSATTGAAAVLKVGDGGVKTINEALSKAKPGDTIEVVGGTYSETLKLNKKIHIKGINNPVITSKGGYVIDITSSGVTVEGFTIKYEGKHAADDVAILVHNGSQGVLIKKNVLKNVMFGIKVVESLDTAIVDNTVEGIEDKDENTRGTCITAVGTLNLEVSGNKITSCRDGIYMEVSHYATVTDNEVTNSRYAIHTMWVDSGNFCDNIVIDNLVGMAIMYTKHTVANRNIAVGNKTHGLLINQTIRSEINENISIGNTKGIFLYNSIENEVKSNLVMNNNIGIHSWGGSEENKITGNSLIDNEVQVKYVAAKDQEWNGNYWSDYLGWDMTGKGSGDMPYESNTVVDHIFWRYPLAKLLYSSPAIHVLKIIEKQFPILKVPKVTDRTPSMAPLHKNWRLLKAKYANYQPARYHVDIQKLSNTGGIY